MQNCNEKCIVYKRIVGYYSPLHQWNPGKREESEQRVDFKLSVSNQKPEEEQKDIRSSAGTATCL